VVEWASEKFDGATAHWCFPRLGQDEENWLRRLRDEWTSSSEGWQSFVREWATRDGLHRGEALLQRSSGRVRAQAGEPRLVSYLSARWTLSSTASGQDVPGQKSDDDDRRRDRDDGDGGGGYDHAAILASVPGVDNQAMSVAQLAEIEKLEAWLFAIARLASERGLGALVVLCARPPLRSGRRCLLESPLAVCSRGGVAVAERAAVPVETQRCGVIA
jgi:hypothetical protein